MSKTLVKPRWETWENSCLQTAFSDKIQQKIVAIALGRSATSVNKKITNLGLRSPSTLRRRRRIGGEKQFLSQEEKTPQDLEKMIKILETYAPLHSFQEGCFALKNGFWTQSEEFLQTDQNKGDHLGKLHPIVKNTKQQFLRRDHPLLFSFSCLKRVVVGPVELVGNSVEFSTDPSGRRALIFSQFWLLPWLAVE